MKIPIDTRCECADSGCPMHENTNLCDCLANVILYRIDMDDYTGTAFCDDCANDATMSGLFTDSLEEVLAESEEEF
jgi:hypothetical protein